MSITTLSIGGIDYTSYASLTEANNYLAVDPVRKDSWRLLSDDDKSINLVSATRRLDMLTWQGSKTGSELTQANQWPRSGMTYPDGTAIGTTDVPIEVENATCLLAGSITIKAAVSEDGGSGSNIKSVKAGSAEVQFFRSQEGKPLQDESAFNLIQFLLEAASTSSELGPLASGIDGTSTFSDIDSWGVNSGYP